MQTMCSTGRAKKLFELLFELLIQDLLQFFNSRLMLGTGKYKTPPSMPVHTTGVCCFNNSDSCSMPTGSGQVLRLTGTTINEIVSGTLKASTVFHTMPQYFPFWGLASVTGKSTKRSERKALTNSG